MELALTTNLFAKIRLYVTAATILACQSLSAASSQTANQDTPIANKATKNTEVTLWMGNVSEVRKAHETEVVRLALEKSRERYGPYQLKITQTSLSRPRTIRTFGESDVAQVVTSTALAYKVDSGEQPLVIIPIPLLQGLLGSRQAIVLRQRAGDFATLKTLTQLRQFSAGLGFDWLEPDLFRDAELPFTTGVNIGQLFNMLAHGRFDYLPLGVLEASSALAAVKHPEQFTIVDNLIIRYPLPVYVQVSRHRPDLIERLTFGLERARDDGSLTALFNQHYGQISALTGKATTITLPSKTPAPLN